MLREAASRLQQRIQKHLLDSEDRKEQGVQLDGENKRDLADKKLENLDQRGDGTEATDYQVTTPLTVVLNGPSLRAEENTKP